VFAELALNNGNRLPSPSPLGSAVPAIPGGVTSISATELAEYEGPDVSEAAETPFEAQNPYDRYFRPVYRNMVFDDLFIPRRSILT